MDPLSITASLITTAQIAGEVQALLDTSEEPSPALSEIRSQIAGLRNVLDVLAHYIMRADRVMFSSQAIDSTQPVLLKLSEILQKFLKTCQRGYLAESKKPIKRIIRVQDESSLREIIEKLDRQKGLLQDRVVFEYEREKVISAHLGNDHVL
jgi:hypothetical protein